MWSLCRCSAARDNPVRLAIGRNGDERPLELLHQLCDPLRAELLRVLFKLSE